MLDLLLVPAVRRGRALQRLGQVGGGVVGHLHRSLLPAGKALAAGQRPGRRVVISCTNQPLPSGSLNDTNEP